MLLQLDRQMITLAVQLNLGASAGRAGRPRPAAVVNPHVPVHHDGAHGPTSHLSHRYQELLWVIAESGFFREAEGKSTTCRQKQTPLRVAPPANGGSPAPCVTLTWNGGLVACALTWSPSLSPASCRFCPARNPVLDRMSAGSTIARIFACWSPKVLSGIVVP